MSKVRKIYPEIKDPRTIEQIFQEALEAGNAVAADANKILITKEIKPFKFDDLDSRKQDLIDNLSSDKGNATVVMSIILAHRANEAALVAKKQQNLAQETLADLEKKYKEVLENQDTIISNAKKKLNQKDADFFNKGTKDQNYEDGDLYFPKADKKEGVGKLQQDSINIKKKAFKKSIADAEQTKKYFKKSRREEQKLLGEEIRNSHTRESVKEDIKNIAKKMANVFLFKKSQYEITETKRDELRAKQKMLGRVIRSDQITGIVDKISDKIRGR